MPIPLEYWESGHDAWVRLAWSGPNIAKEIIPTTHLYPTADAEKPAGLTGRYYGKGNPECAAAVQKTLVVRHCDLKGYENTESRAADCSSPSSPRRGMSRGITRTRQGGRGFAPDPNQVGVPET